jgi:amino-acid N-acetyltransferase
MNLSIEPARPDDFAAVAALLEQSGLPKDGLADHLATAIVARDDGRVVGSATLEMYGTAALLRSVAVDSSWRGRELGQRLTQAALDLAHQRGVSAVYLLTETAGEFFPRFGFRRTTRAEVPQSVQKSVEFTTACPDSALVMMVAL